MTFQSLMRDAKTDARAKGEAKGRAEGRAEGESKFSQLVKFLLSAGRTKDLERAADDSAFRASLFAEFGIA